MNVRTIKVQTPVVFPEERRKKGVSFFHAFRTDEGFDFRWVPLTECPIYVHSKTGIKAHLAMSLKTPVSEIPVHGKAVLTFEEILFCQDTTTVYSKWRPSEWFPYLQKTKKTPTGNTPPLA